MNIKKLFIGISSVLIVILVMIHAFSQGGSILPSQAATGDVDTIAGTGVSSYTGDNGPAILATLNGGDLNIALDTAKNLYIADSTNHVIRKIDYRSGIIRTVAGDGSACGTSTDPCGDGGLATSAQLNSPFGVAVDASGNIFIADKLNNKIRRVDAGTGNISTIAGTGVASSTGDGAAATSATVNNPADLVFDSTGNLYIAEQGGHTIRVIDTGGDINAFAGNGVNTNAGDGGLATAASMSEPTSVEVDSNDDVYMTSQNTDAVRKITIGTGIIDKVAGDGTPGFSGDGGAATSAQLQDPVALAIDENDNLFINDTTNNRIRRVDSGTGNISTFAGDGTSGFTGDGGAATSARFNTLLGIAVDENGAVYVSDSGNRRIRRIEGQNLSVVAVTPLQNAVNVAVDGNISIQFNQTMDLTTVTANTLPVIGVERGALAGAYSLSTTSISNDTVVFNPTNDFRTGEQIEVMISKDVQGTSDNTLLEGHTFRFTAAVAVSGSTFTEVTSASIQNNSGQYGTALGDFNGDGNLDLVALHIGPDANEAAEIYQGDGAGNFSFVTSFAFANNSRPDNIETGDFDLDGDLDFVMNSANVSDFDVFIGNGDLTFSRQTIDSSISFVTGHIPIIDFNGDGFQEAPYLFFSGLARIAYNLTNAVFSTTKSFTFDVSSSLGAEAGDFNNDFFADLVAASRNDSKVSVLPGEGNGDFGASITSNANTFTVHEAMWVGDLDGDNDLDAMTRGSDGASKFAVMLNNGSGTLTEDSTLNSDRAQFRITDYDADGDLDAVTISSSDVEVFTNDGSGGMSIVNRNYSGSADPFLATGDVNNDGTVDVVVVKSGQVLALLQQQDLLVTAQTPAQHEVDVAVDSDISLVFDASLNVGTVTSSNVKVYDSEKGLVAGTLSVSTTTLSNDTLTFDPNNDFIPGADVRIVITSAVQSLGGLSARPYNGEFAVAVSIGGGGYSAATNYTMPSGVLPQIYSADLDNDGDMDLVSTQGNLSVLINNGDGTFAAAVSYATGGSTPNGIALADVDNDSFLDIIVSNRTSDNVGVLINAGNGTFGAATNYTAGDDCRSVAAGDIDGDGDVDFVVANRGDADVSVFLNNGGGTFAAAVDYQPVGGVAFTNGVALGDMDRDGDLDMVQSFQSPSGVNIFPNNGDGSFGSPTNYASAGDEHFNVLLYDFNGDNYLDFASGRVSSGAYINVALNDQSGGLLASTNVTTDANPLGIDVADVDADGDLDIVSTNGNSTDDSLSVLRNNGSGVFAAPESVAGGANSDPAFVTLNDFNGDGAVDMAFVKQLPTDLAVILADPAPTVTVVQPNGGESLSVGAMYDITWTATDNSGTVSSVDLQLTIDDSSYSAIVGATGLSNALAYPFVSAFGSSGGGDGQFDFAEGIEIAPDGSIFVADTFNNRVQKFDADGNFLLKWSSGFSLPLDLTVDNTGDVYVADHNNHKIQKFDSSGNFILEWGSQGTGDGQFDRVHHVATDNAGNVYVTERDNHRMQKFTSTGTFIGCIGGGVNGFQTPCLSFSSGSGTSQFSFPAGIDIDSSGNIYIAEQGGNRVQKFDSSGNFLLQWSASFGQSFGLAIDSQDNVFVSERGNDRIQKFSSTGTPLVTFGSSGSANGLFDVPSGVAVDSRGSVYVADSRNDRIQKFSPGGVFSWTVTGPASNLARVRAIARDANNSESQDDSDAVFDITVNAAPVATVPSGITQESGNIVFQTTVSDPDSDTTRLEVQYSDDGGTTFYDAEIDSAVPDSGSVDLDNATQYQIGSTDAIDSDGGAVTLTIAWDTQSANNGNGVVAVGETDLQLRVIPNDSALDGSNQTSGNFSLENVGGNRRTRASSGDSAADTSSSDSEGSDRLRGAADEDGGSAADLERDDVTEPSVEQTDELRVQLAIEQLNVLKQLFAWKNPESYQLTKRARQELVQVMITMRKKMVIQSLGKFLNLANGFELRDPDMQQVDNVAEFMKLIIISFSDCFSEDQVLRAMSHDVPENPYWWAGYWHLIGDLIEQFYGPGFLLWSPLDDLYVLDVLTLFLEDYCGQVEV